MFKFSKIEHEIFLLYSDIFKIIALTDIFHVFSSFQRVFIYIIFNLIKY